MASTFSLLENLPARKRRAQKPKRYSRPVPGDRVQLDTCKIRPGLHQFTAVDDCSRYLVAGLARRRSAAATLSFLDQVLDEMPFAIQRVQRAMLEELWAAVDERAPEIGDQLASWVHHSNWDRPHEALGGDCPIDRVCQRAGETPLWDAVSDAFDATKEAVQVREYVADRSLRKLR